MTARGGSLGESWLDRANFRDGFARSDITVVNWPQNDYWLGPVVGVNAAERERHLDAAPTDLEPALLAADRGAAP
jgi:hypothetical protein